MKSARAIRRPRGYDLACYADRAFHGDSIVGPRYGRADYMSVAEENHVHALYAASVTAVDRWIGRLLEKLETLRLDRNTLLIFLSDHGHLLGEHGLHGKPTGPYGRLYEVTARVPLLVRHPAGLGAGRWIPDIAQHPDLLPTILDYLDIPRPADLPGRSLWPAINGKDSNPRPYAFSGRFARTAGERVVCDAERFDSRAGGDGGGEPTTVTSNEWALVCPPGTEGRELYHLPSDPRQGHDVIGANPDVADRMHRAFVELLKESGAIPERIRLYTEPQPSPGWPTRLR